MPTAAFSTDGVRRAVADVGHLLRFRSASTKRKGSRALLTAAFVTLSGAAAVVPAFVSGAESSQRAFDVLLVLPTAMVGFLLLSVISAAASGGGRELLARDPASIHPISPTTDHLGALLLAPLNIAWLLPAWGLLGSTAYGVGPGGLVPALLVVLLWLVAATAVAQVLAWTMEGIRRLPRGRAMIRTLTLAVLGGVLGLQMTERLVPLLDQVPTRWVVAGMTDGFSWRWALTAVIVLGLLLVAVVVGAVPAHLAARRAPADELRVETSSYPARRLPGSALAGLVRIDRASVWRAVPMRRGVLVLALGPGLVAVIGDLQWSSMTILPGLVASGGALLYGVNAWCLDARGALWRESLPVQPGVVFAARALVLAEFLLAASLLTVALAAVRAGVPDLAQLTALVCTLVVVTVQVVAAALRWSAQRPFAVDLRSARATPAPPLVMIGYSTRLALSTTLTGLVFSLLSRVPQWQVTVLVALAFLCWSTVRLLRARRIWLDPPARARIVTTVAA